MFLTGNTAQPELGSGIGWIHLKELFWFQWALSTDEERAIWVSGLFVDIEEGGIK